MILDGASGQAIFDADDDTKAHILRQKVREIEVSKVQESVLAELLGDEVSL